jgi:DNA-directed RNA polymerase specialized sigma subunit
MIEPFRARGAWNVHESARLALRSSLGEKNPRYFRELSRRAIRCFDGDEPYMRIERVYHRLVVSPEEAEAELASLTDEWLDGKHEPLQALGVALDELPHVRSIAKSIQDRLPSSRSADDLISKGIVGLADEIGRYYSSKDATEEFFERLELHNLLGEALERLPHLEKTVISLYYREEMTLREIAKILELHESRISQLKSQAVLRLRRYLQKRWPLKGQA